MMKKNLTLLIMLHISFFIFSQQDASKLNIDWRLDYKQALEEAKILNKNVFPLFMSPDELTGIFSFYTDPDRLHHRA